jgi:hypothetical protein
VAYHFETTDALGKSAAGIMSGAWSYDRLPSIHETRDRDITEYVAAHVAATARPDR